MPALKSCFSFLPVLAFSLVAPLTASAATLCVNNDGSYPCYARISDAVAAAAPGDVIRVGFGTYYDSVVINKPLSLVSETAVVDAGGRSRGFYVNGLNSPGLTGVNISGFTVRNARFEGILVSNAAAVTLSNNTLYANNQALSNGICKGLEDFESGGQADCGGAIHLLGADHAVVTNNNVQGNAAGIVISDDTAAAHDNLLSFNTIAGNAYASGIALVSNAVALMNQRLGPVNHGSNDAGDDPDDAFPAFGVYHNTIYGNRSRGNGLANASGAGVSLTAVASRASLYGNVIVANLLMENARPGVAMRAEAVGQVLNDNLVVGNTVINNAAEGGPMTTQGPTGLSLYSASGTTGNMLVGNQIQSEAVDVAVDLPVPVQVAFNSLLGSGMGIANLGNGQVLAQENFWSCANGPTIQYACSSVFGPSVQWDPALTLPLPIQPNF